jgi:hypothetical protein
MLTIAGGIVLAVVFLMFVVPLLGGLFAHVMIEILSANGPTEEERESRRFFFAWVGGIALFFLAMHAFAWIAERL